MKTVDRVLAIANYFVGYREKATNDNLDSHEGNAGHNNYQRFGRDLYKAGFFNGNKNGYEWCTQFVVGCVYYVTRDREVTEHILCHDGELGAGCVYAGRYYKNHNRFYTSDPKPGDQVFFRGFSHTGFVEYASEGKLHTIEGNSSDRVEKRVYDLNDRKIDGYGRPDYELLADNGCEFADVDVNDYWYDAVVWAGAEKVVAGISPRIFAPYNECTRGQAVTMLWRANGSPEPNGYMPFDDVSPVDYYARAIQWAVENGITVGIDAHHFGPDMVCTRGQFVTFLWRMNGKPMVEAENPFVDVIADAYYYNAVLWAVNNGVVKGADAKHFEPDSKCDRAMSVTMLYRAK